MRERAGLRERVQRTEHRQAVGAAAGQHQLGEGGRGLVFWFWFWFVFLFWFWFWLWFVLVLVLMLMLAFAIWYGCAAVR